MPIDPAGVTPGLAASTQPDARRVNMKCKRSDCDSITAIDVAHPQSLSGRHMYQCVKCRTSWGVNTGGSIDL